MRAERHAPTMDEQNRDHFYEGPPLESEEHWHDGALVDAGGQREGHAAEDEGRAELGAPLVDVELPEGGVYPPQAFIERPHAPEAGLPHGSLTRDPSLSRAVEREHEGLDADAAGYDRSVEGPAPGPLEPDAERVPADSQDLPGGQYGSSG
jgi:hypothetical protein